MCKKPRTVDDTASLVKLLVLLLRLCAGFRTWPSFCADGQLMSLPRAGLSRTPVAPRPVSSRDLKLTADNERWARAANVESWDSFWFVDDSEFFFFHTHGDVNYKTFFQPIFWSSLFESLISWSAARLVNHWTSLSQQWISSRTASLFIEMFSFLMTFFSWDHMDSNLILCVSIGSPSCYPWVMGLPPFVQ